MLPGIDNVGDKEENEEAIADMISMGFDGAGSRVALRLTNNDKAKAIELVMGGDITDLLALEQLSGGRGAKIHPQPVSEEEPSRQSQSPFKMVIMVRKDLGMSTGKVAAQVGHAVLEAFKAASTNAPILVFEWEQVGSAKIVLQVKDQQELTTIGNAALENGLIVAFIKDAGRTQVEAGTKTVCAIGPDYSLKIDKFTGHLHTF